MPWHPSSSASRAAPSVVPAWKSRGGYGGSAAPNKLIKTVPRSRSPARAVAPGVFHAHPHVVAARPRGPTPSRAGGLLMATAGRVLTGAHPLVVELGEVGGSEGCILKPAGRRARAAVAGAPWETRRPRSSRVRRRRPSPANIQFPRTARSVPSETSPGVEQVRVDTRIGFVALFTTEQIARELDGCRDGCGNDRIRGACEA